MVQTDENPVLLVQTNGNLVLLESKLRQFVDEDAAQTTNVQTNGISCQNVNAYICHSELLLLLYISIIIVNVKGE